MRPPDAIVGWDDEITAELYAAFTRDYPMYTDTSRDLAARAQIGGSDVVVDLCGGTGATAGVLLEALPGNGRVISVDNARAMQTVGRRTLNNPRITWVESRAEDVADHVTEPVDAVVCNSAIWKTDTVATFAAVKSILRRGGRFTFNIGGGFAGVGTNSDGPERSGPSLNDLINSIAVRDYGHVQHPDETDQPILTAAVVGEQLKAAGFDILASDVVNYPRTMEERRAWLSIPLFSRPSGALTYPQRMEILRKAFGQMGTAKADSTTWLIFTARA